MTLGLLAAICLSANAGTVKFDFTTDNYGLTPYDEDKGNNSPYLTNGESVTLENVKITFSGTDADSWRMWSDGLREYYKRGAYFTVTTTNGENVTEVSWTNKSGATFALDGTTTNITKWTGNQPSVKFVTTAAANAALYTISVTYGDTTGGGGDNPGGGDTGGDEEPGDATITDVLKNLSLGQSVTATAVVTGQAVSSLVLTDKAGSITYYNTALNLSDYPVGTVVTISGTLDQYGRGLQFTNAATIKKVGTETVTYPSPVNYTGAMVNTACEGTDNFQATYITLTGEVVINNNYYNITIPGSDFMGSIYYPTDNIKNQITSGTSYQLTGYFVAVSGNTTKYFNILVTELKEVSSSDTPQGVISVAQALNMASDEPVEATVTGYIISTPEISTYYGYATYLIADDATAQSGLKVFRGKYIDGAEFTSATQIAQGGKVEVAGYLFKLGDTSEIVASSLVSYEAPAGGGSGSETPSVKTDYEFNLKEESVYKTFTIQNTNLPSELDYVWNYDSRYGAKASAYANNTRYAATAWLITPEIDLTNLSSASLVFNQAINQLNGGTILDICQVYVGEAGTPTSGWSNISGTVSYPEGTSWTFLETEPIDLASFLGKKVQIGFCYNSTSSSAPTWEIDNVAITGTASVAELEIAPIKDGVFYNLQGMPVANPVKGQIYIVNGKKVIF